TFKRVALCVGTIQYSKIVVAPSANGSLRRNPIGNLASLFSFVVNTVYLYRCAFALGSPKLFIGTLCVFGNNRVSSIQNITRATVILFEFYNFCTRKVTFEIKNVRKISTAPTINRLPVIANHTNILLFVNKELYKLVLRRVGVLVLIYQNIFKLFAPFFTNLLIIA